MEELYITLGEAKCQELSKKDETLWYLLKCSPSPVNAEARGAVLEGLSKDFIREFLPSGFGLKSGLVFDSNTKKMSPQIDALIYKGAPLLEFTDVVVVEKEQVKAIFEIKSWIDEPAIFGTKHGAGRDPNTGLVLDFKRKKGFLPLEANYILFAFDLYSASTDDEIIDRLNEICDIYAIVLRWEPKQEQKPNIYNFDNSVSRLIEWLRNLA